MLILNLILRVKDLHGREMKTFGSMSKLIVLLVSKFAVHKQHFKISQVNEVLEAGYREASYQ